MSARLDRLLSRTGRDLFVPLSFRLSAKLEQMDWEELLEDPTYTAFALRNAQKLFRADGVVNWFDTCLEAEAAGVEVERDEMGGVVGRGDPIDSLPEAATFLQRGAIPPALDVARRLCEETRDESAVLGYLTGPRTLLAHLFGEERQRRLLQAGASGEEAAGGDLDALDGAVGLSLQLARAYCEVGVGALLLAEGQEAAEDSGYLKGLEPILNLANYYDVPLLLLERHPVPSRWREQASRAGFRYVSAPRAGSPEEALADGVCPVPTEPLTGEGFSAEEWLRERRGEAGGARIYVSEWELPVETLPENLIDLGRSLGG